MTYLEFRDILAFLAAVYVLFHDVRMCSDRKKKHARPVVECMDSTITDPEEVSKDGQEVSVGSLLLGWCGYVLYARYRS